MTSFEDEYPKIILMLALVSCIAGCATLGAGAEVGGNGTCFGGDDAGSAATKRAWRRDRSSRIDFRDKCAVFLLPQH
jgi:hypothetical protein